MNNQPFSRGFSFRVVACEKAFQPWAQGRPRNGDEDDRRHTGDENQP